MWELDYKENWVPKNGCFWTVVLEKTLESPLYCVEIHLVHPKGNQSWIFIGRTDAEAESPKLCPPDVNWLIGKDPDTGKDWKQEEKQTTEDKMVGWHKQLTQWTWVWASSRKSDGQGSLVCCIPWVCKELDTTGDWTYLNSVPQRKYISVHNMFFEQVYWTVLYQPPFVIRENNLTMCIIDKILLRQRPMGRAADRLHASLLHVPVMFVFTRHFCIIQRLASLLCYKYREWCYAQNVQDQCIYVKCNLLTFHKFAWIYNVCISVLPLWAI